MCHELLTQGTLSQHFVMHVVPPSGYSGLIFSHTFWVRGWPRQTRQPDPMQILDFVHADVAAGGELGAK